MIISLLQFCSNNIKTTYIQTLLPKKWLEARKNYIYSNCRKLNALLILFEQNFDRAHHFLEIL